MAFLGTAFAIGAAGCFFTAVAAAFAPGVAFAAARSRYTAPADGKRAAQAGSPAGTAAPVLAGMAVCRAMAVAAGSTVAAVVVASTNCPYS